MIIQNYSRLDNKEMIVLQENITAQTAKHKTIFHFHKGLKYHCFYFKAQDSRLFSYSDKYNDDLYNGDVCEIFIKYGKKNHYYEIEVAPNGAVFLADIENINGKFNGLRLSNNFTKTTVKCGQNDYIVKIKIPRSLIKTKKVEFNAFRIETEGGTKQNLYALYPTMCNTFHVIDCLKSLR